MIRDRYLLWLIIVALGVLILAQLIGNGMLSHWQAQDDAMARPNPRYFELGGH